ncbi:cell division cycle 48 [Rhynchospora pubera]|uniref:Cell division cycle 48 n=1 Tax=Rhynchospora pubera TaxID=906938 RepID=A0AAV8FWI3_9POAL|nr:cell division cycle 48 [Rhynchospora pubera]
MPPKGKKNPKPSSSLFPSPRTPSTPLSASSSSAADDDSLHLQRILSALSSAHPSLLPSASSAFSGTIVECEASLSKGNRAVVYLSEAALVSSSFHPGSLVSVFLVPLETQLDGSDVCAVDADAGRQFSIATVFPSRKVIKAGVRLSWGLSCTMGFPTIGQGIIISPLSSNLHINKCELLRLRLINEAPDTSSACELALRDEKVKDLVQILVSRWIHGWYLLKGNVIGVPVCGKTCMFHVTGSGLESDVLLVDGSIRVELLLGDSLLDGNGDEPSKNITLPEHQGGDEWDSGFPKLGGLSKEFEDLKEIISFSLAKDETLPRYKGILLYGPPGTGKTSLGSMCAKVAGAQLFTINGPEIISQYYGESEQALHDVFISAKKAAPSVVFIDELDAIAPARKDGTEGLSLRVVATLLKIMDEIKQTDRVIVIAATNRPDSIDPALRRPGRLDREIEIGVPSPEQRLDILTTILSIMDNSLSQTELQMLASETHGFVGADLAALGNEAALNALRRHIKLKGRKTAEAIVALSESLSKLTVSSEDVTGMIEEEDLMVTIEDFEKAKLKVCPSAMREVMLELPKVRWEDVGGQSKIKEQLIEAVQWPQMCPEAFDRIGIKPPRGLLMIGPPGCSKTLMARAVASEAKLNFLAVKGPELFSKWVGESEKAVKALFTKARANKPAIIFFDEIDGLAVTRGSENDGVSVADRVLSQLLVEMDGLDLRTGVTVIAATNRPDKIDPALLRPGRFDRLLDVQPPDEADREEIFGIHTKKMPCGADVRLRDLAVLTEGYTGADIKLVCREAAILALEESFDINEVSMHHFKNAVSKVRPSDLEFYQNLATQFRRLVDATSVRDVNNI